jgi:lysophospholipase L1-like esterase
MLACICAFFPKKGVSIGSLHLHFPSFEKVLTRNSEKADVDVNSLLEITKNIDSCLQTSKDTIAHYVKELSVSPAKFYFPNNNLSYFDPLFEAMSKAEQSGVTIRILHYGDSQIELDRLSYNLRSFFQEMFGGSGPGMLPLIQNISTASVSQYTTGETIQYAAYGETKRRMDGLYGLMAKCFTINREVAFNVTAAKSKQTDSNLKRFSNVKLLMNVHGSNFTATLKNQATDYGESQTTSHGLQLLEWQFDKPVSNLRLNLQGNADIYGIMIDGNGGIAVDNIPMRGCSGTIFTRINDSLLLKSYQMLDIGLIILQFGGNSIPSINSQKAVDDYKARIVTQIQYLKQLCPQACILFIGPSDMCTGYQGKMRTYTHLPATVQALREAATENGAAFWNLYEVMGGRNSMIAWVRNGMAGSDYIHFTTGGAQKVGNVLSHSFRSLYELYLMRKDMPKQQFNKLWNELENIIPDTNNLSNKTE